MNETPRNPSDDDWQPPGADEGKESPPPMPDEDGPHDVPDEQVIEKTLPSGPASKPRTDWR